jgi:hypothetical protein
MFETQETSMFAQCSLGDVREEDSLSNVISSLSSIDIFFLSSPSIRTYF